MSGFALVVDLGGGAAPADVLHRVAAPLRRRRPDALRLRRWCGAGLAHAPLRTSRSAPAGGGMARGEHLCVVCDARFDGRDELVRALERRTGRRLAEADDAELVLRLYAERGADGLDVLEGDFAIALFDASRRRVVLARDAFGVKPLFHARVGERLVVSSSLACVLAHPGVDTAVDEETVGDFLVTGENPRLGATFFRGIRRLRPAHRLALTRDGSRSTAVAWLPSPGASAVRDPGDAVEGFREHLGRAVSDRLDGERASILLSGGVDSTAVAATAAEVLSRRGAPPDLLGCTLVYDRLIPHAERHFAGLAAHHLGIPVHYVAADDCELYATRDRPGPPPLQPVIDPYDSGDALFAAAEAHAPVLLTGDGGDAALHTSPAFWTRLARRAGPVPVLREALRHVGALGRPPRVGLRSRWRGRPRPVPLPAWIEPGFARRTGLAERWRRWYAGAPVDPTLHPDRPEACARLLAPTWANHFESLDPGNTELRLEVRHPFFDLRLLRFLLALPPVPWCIDKEIVRRAMRGRLPRAVRRRPKAALAAWPVHPFPAERLEALARELREAPHLERFVRVEALVELLSAREAVPPQALQLAFPALGLAAWLHGRTRTACSPAPPSEDPPCPEEPHVDTAA